jgi:hypothetical protein
LQLPQAGAADNEATRLKAVNEAAIRQSDAFFAHETPDDFELRDGMLRFSSPVSSPWPENNVVHGKWFPAVEKPGRARRAVVVLPHWNASANQHEGLCSGLAKFGISALRMSKPYHDYRMPAELHRADYAVSSNIARTLDATRQAVLDVRACVDWLNQQGYERVGIVGTSLGSCIAFLASAHEPRIRVNVFNHCSSTFADVVWTGMSTLHVRKGLDGHITLDQLRNSWMAISPVSYMERFAALGKKTRFIYTRFDTTFPLAYSKEILAEAQRCQVDCDIREILCGHYTMGETPFKFIDGYYIFSWLLKHL